MVFLSTGNTPAQPPYHYEQVVEADLCCRVGQVFEDIVDTLEAPFNWVIDRFDPPVYERLPAQQLPNYSDQTSYFDMGAFPVWDFIYWNQVNPNEGYEEFNVPNFTTYLQSLFTDMKNAGMDQIDLSFAQLSDLDAFVSGDYSKISPNDAIGVLLQQMVQDKVHFPPNTDILRLICQIARPMNMKVNLSLGGENASPSDFTICKQGETATGQAQKLAGLMQSYGMSNADFDVEGANAYAFTHDPNAVPFFSALHQTLSSLGKTTTLTIQGSLTQTVWGSSQQKDNPSSFNGPLKPFFYDANNQPVFTQFFDGLNLMMYDNGSKYYLDARLYADDTIIPDWLIEDWLFIVGPENAGLLHIGFQDATLYQAANSSASGHTYYEPNDPTDPLAVKTTDEAGVAGAKIFLQIQRTLIQDGYTTPLGQPFWWPNYVPYRYAPTSDEQAQFVSRPMYDFYTTLGQLSSE